MPSARFVWWYRPAVAAPWAAVWMLGFVVAATGCSTSSETTTSEAAASPDSGPTSTVAEPVDPFEGAVELAGRAGFGDPLEVEMPEPSDADALEFLESDGDALVVLVEQTRPLWESGATACATVPQRLDDLGAPGEVLALAAAVPDPVTVDVFTGLHTATGSLLAACGDDDTFEPALEEFSFTWLLASRRLDQLGVTR